MTLQIRNLSISFGARCVSHVESMDLEASRILGLVGESGSGKSITANAIMGMAGRLGASVSGSILLDGRTELVGASERLLRSVRGRRIASIFQSPATSFHPLMNLGVIFRRTLQLHEKGSRRELQARAEAAVADMMLSPQILNRYPHELSGGQLQRVAIALALALDADLLLADEPTSALDVTVQAEILTLLTGLRDRRNLSVLLISHDLAAVAQVADNIVVMRAGQVVESGATSAVIHHPESDYTRNLLAAVPVLGRAHRKADDDAAG